jgi:hypothetical protein
VLGEEGDDIMPFTLAENALGYTIFSRFFHDFFTASMGSTGLSRPVPVVPPPRNLGTMKACFFSKVNRREPPPS